MKNQYFGDVGDFGNYGLLSAISSSGMKIGVNWYLTHNDDKTDGKFIDYLNKSEFVDSDVELADFLKGCLDLGRRNVSELKNFKRFTGFEYHDDILELKHIKALSESGRRKRLDLRTKWFEDSLIRLSGCDLIFCDPDNGIFSFSLSTCLSTTVKIFYAHTDLSL